MMRALAVLSAAAVALLALPTTAGAAADSATPASGAASTATDGIVDFLSERSWFGMSMGAVLWLSVAALAALLAFVALNRSRGHLAAADSAGADAVTRPDFARINSASAAR